jgi:hypothetical protein
MVNGAAVLWQKKKRPPGTGGLDLWLKKRRAFKVALGWRENEVGCPMAGSLC